MLPTLRPAAAPGRRGRLLTLYREQNPRFVFAGESRRMRLKRVGTACPHPCTETYRTLSGFYRDLQDTFRSHGSARNPFRSPVDHLCAPRPVSHAAWSPQDRLHGPPETTFPGPCPPPLLRSPIDFAAPLLNPVSAPGSSRLRSPEPAVAVDTAMAPPEAVHSLEVSR